MGNSVHSSNSDNRYSASAVSHSRRLLAVGCKWIAVLLQFSIALPWNIQKILMWILSQWTATFILMQSTQKHRRILSIFRTLRLPASFSWHWWLQPEIVYMRISVNGDFYIGSTEGSVFDREQTRMRKFRQLCSNQLAYFEPALKLWHRLDNFFDFAIFPISHEPNDTVGLLSREQAFQQTFRPMYNWPWITPQLKKWKVGKQRYEPTSLTPSCQHGQKLVRRYLKRKRGDQCPIYSQCVDKHTRIFHLLYLLGSDTMMKFECSKLLRSTKADTDYVFLMYRLSRNMTEPFRSRAQNQLRLILQFRGADVPPSNLPLRLLIVSDHMELQMKEWMTGFILHHQVNFPPFHKPRSPILGIKGRTLGSYLYNFRTKLRWWQPTSQVHCACQLFPDYVRQQDRKTVHISVFASDLLHAEDILQAHMQDQVSPSWTQFLHTNTVSFEQFLRRWKLPSSLMQFWQHFLKSVWKPHDEFWTHKQAVRVAVKLQDFVTSPADHFPHSLTLHCPCQWHQLLCRTFLDDNVFTLRRTSPVQTLHHIQNSVPDWLASSYSWGLDFPCLSQSRVYITQTQSTFSQSSTYCQL